MKLIEQQLKAVLGKAQFFLLCKALKKIQVSIDTDEQEFIIYRHNAEPLRIGFEDIEDFINNVGK